QARSVGVGELGGLGGALIHGGGQGNQRVVGLVQDAATFIDVVAVEAHDQRLVRCGAELGQRADDALGHGVTRGDSAEHVHEHGFHLRVAEDDVETGSHYLGRGSTTDVEELRGLHSAVVLASVGNDIQCAHHKPGA